MGSVSEDRVDRDGREDREAREDEAITYERARDELADVVRRLEAGGLTLEESLSLWERGERLATVCERWLAGARERLASAVSAAQPGASLADTTAAPGDGGGDTVPSGEQRPNDEAPF